ncbi:MAG TPA: 30S ribosomal protein S4 [Candidatus Nanoarchaeia archaeon]|nr:30S ribosomal protein S4 [Candidatus Nanoarchaeia archaeon]
MIRKRKNYVRPRKAYEKTRIADEDALVKQYGLKNKREIWKTAAKISYFRRRAKDSAKESLAEQQVLFEKLQSLGLKINGTADVLDLKVTDLLERRLPTIVYKQGLAFTPQQARQMVVHRKILVNGVVVNIPSYLVRKDEETAITATFKPTKPEKQEEEEHD